MDTPEVSVLAGLMYDQERKRVEVRTFAAPDIHCDGCAASIRRSLGKMAGVQDMDVNVQDRTVTITFDPEKTTVAAVLARLEQAGFPVE